MKTHISFLIVCCIAATALAARSEGGEQRNTTTTPTEQQIHRTSDEERSLKHLMLGGALLDSLERSSHKGLYRGRFAPRERGRLRPQSRACARSAPILAFPP